VSQPAAQLTRPARMTHVAIRAPELDAAVDFYRRYAGLVTVHEREDDGIRVVWLSDRGEDPDFVLVLLAMPHERMREPAATDHFGFDVATRDDVDRIAELARSEGILKYGPVDAGPIVGYFVMVRDPSGNTCEFSHGQPINPRNLRD
jgi:catechol 2,3-dioxygenase-like lactoylglutathione lyase family enzyme